MGKGLYTQLKRGKYVSYPSEGPLSLRLFQEAMRDYFYPRKAWAIKALRYMEELEIEDDKMRELLKQIINE